MQKKSGKRARWLLLVAFSMALTVGSGFYHSLMAMDEKTYKSINLFANVLEELKKNYVDEVDTDALTRIAIRSMVSSLDPHSGFLPPEIFNALQDQTMGEFGGIGLSVAMIKSHLTVISPIEGTPAHRAGIKSGDIINKIDHQVTQNMALWECLEKMKGPKGKTIILTIIRDGEPDPIVFQLTRDHIPMKSVYSAMIDPAGYGYLAITHFRTNTVEDLENALEDLESADTQLIGLIIDLRNNPGGILFQAVEISDLFLDKGVIVSIKGRDKKHFKVFKANPNYIKREYPIAILINRGSASASEIVAGALQDQKRALIVGSPSFGKGSVQTVIPLKDGYGLKYTIARYFTPNNRSIQGKGIQPDINVAYTPDEDGLKKISDLPLDKEKGTKKANGSIDIKKLKLDSQVICALDILIGHVHNPSQN